MFGEPRIDTETQMTRVILTLIVEEVLAAKRDGNGQAVRLDERRHVVARVRRPTAAAEDHERPGRLRKLGGERGESVFGGRTARGAELLRVRHHRYLGQHVFGQCEHHRTRAP